MDNISINTVIAGMVALFSCTFGITTKVHNSKLEKTLATIDGKIDTDDARELIDNKISPVHVYIQELKEDIQEIKQDIKQLMRR